MHVKRKSPNAQVNKKWGLFGPTSTFMVAIRERRVLVGIIQTKTVSRGSRYQAKSQFELQLFVNLPLKLLGLTQFSWFWISKERT